MPQNVIKDELTRNGIKSLVKKYELMSLICMVWQYRKINQIPIKYYLEDDDDDGEGK